MGIYNLRIIFKFFNIDDIKMLFYYDLLYEIL